MTEPTDAELWQLHMQMPGAHKDPIDFARAVLAKWGTPAGAGEVVAHRVMRKSLSGEWASDARDWSDGPPSRALVDSICADKGRWRIDVAYAAPASVACEPLTDEQAASLCKMGPVYAPDGRVVRTPEQYRRELEGAKLAGIRTAERAHGIKGGQHGESV